MSKGLLPLLLIGSVAGAAPMRIAAPGLTGIDLDPAKVTFLLEYLAQAMASPELRIITQKEIATLVGVERQRALLCSETGSDCLAELGAALGSEMVLLGELAHIGKRYQYSLKVISAKDAAPLASRVGKAESEEELVDLLAVAGKELGDELRERFHLSPAQQLVAASARPGSRLWLVPAVGGGIATAAGVGLILGAGSTARPLFQATVSQPLPLGEAVSIRDRANLEQSVGVTLAVVGGAAAVAGLGWLLLGSRAESPTSVTMVPLPEGAAVSVSGALP